MFFYDVLRISNDATIEEISEAYLEACEIWSPESVVKWAAPEHLVICHSIFHYVQEAFTVLSSHLRGQYDKSPTQFHETDLDTKKIQFQQLLRHYEQQLRQQIACMQIEFQKFKNEILNIIDNPCKPVIHEYGCNKKRKIPVVNIGIFIPQNTSAPQTHNGVTSLVKPKLGV